MKLLSMVGELWVAVEAHPISALHVNFPSNLPWMVPFSTLIPLLMSYTAFFSFAHHQSQKIVPINFDFIKLRGASRQHRCSHISVLFSSSLHTGQKSSPPRYSSELPEPIDDRVVHLARHNIKQTQPKPSTCPTLLLLGQILSFFFFRPVRATYIWENEGNSHADRSRHLNERLWDLGGVIGKQLIRDAERILM